MSEYAAQFLWKLLDDIDTVSDAVKGDDKAYREQVERINRRRFEVGSTDGRTVTINGTCKRPAPPTFLEGWNYCDVCGARNDAPCGFPSRQT